MKSFSLALRNLLRNRRRSLTTLLAIILGCNALLLFGGFSRNISYGLQTRIVQRAGHIQIQHKDFFLFGTGNPGAYGIDRYTEVIAAVRRDPVLAPMLTVVTPTLQMGGIAGNFAAGLSRTFVGAGVVVDDQNAMRNWNDYQYPVQARPSDLTGSPMDAAVIGVGVARVLQLCGPLKVQDCPQAAIQKAPANPAAPDLPQDIAGLADMTRAASGEDKSTPQTLQTLQSPQTRIELLTSSPSGAPNVASVNVVSARSQGIKALDDMYIGLHLQQAQRLVYGREPPRATAIVVQLKHTSQIPAASARLTELLATDFQDQALAVTDFATLNPEYGQAVGMFGAIFSFVSTLIGVIVLFMVGNTMSMAVVERTVEIGTLRAIGMRRGGIRRLFLTEGLLIGVIGSACGVAIALLVAWLVNHSGLTWTPPGEANPVPLSVRVWGQTGMIAMSALGALAVSVLSTLWPAGRAARMNIVDALRHA